MIPTSEQLDLIREAFRQWAFAVTDLGPVNPGGIAVTDAHLDALDSAIAALEDGTASDYTLGMLIGYLGHLSGCTPPDASGAMYSHHDLTENASPVAQAAARLQAAVLATMPPAAAI